MRTIMSGGSELTTASLLQRTGWAMTARFSGVKDVWRLKRRKPSFLHVRVLAILILLACLAGQATAETFFGLPRGDDAIFFVSPHRDDVNDCSSPANACARFQRAVDLCLIASYCLILAGTGTYSQATNVTHFKNISIVGLTDGHGDCRDRHAVNVKNQTDGQPIFWVQDHATLTISCMSLEARGPSQCGFVSRQFAIGDVVDVDVAASSRGCGVAAHETSKINISNPGIYGEASRFAFASDLSQVTIGGLVKIGNVIKFDVAFLASLNNSIVSFYPSGIEGGAHFSGASYQCSNASIKKTVVLPGGDVPYQETDDCTITGGSSISFTLNGLRSEIDSIRSTLNGLRSEINSAGAMQNGLRLELNTIRSEIDDVQHRQNLQRRFDRNVAVIVVLALILAGGATYYRLVTLKK
jgi:hypothetical protein